MHPIQKVDKKWTFDYILILTITLQLSTTSQWY